MESVPVKPSRPVVAEIIRRRAQVVHEINADTLLSDRWKKSGRECQPPMLLRPRVGYPASSASISACSPSFMASASGNRTLPIKVGNVGVTSSSIVRLNQQRVTESASPASLVSLYLLFMSLAV